MIFSTARNYKSVRKLSKSRSQKPEARSQKQKVSAARFAAFEILKKIASEKAFSAILLPAYEENLKPEDRALCHEITLGVLRNQTYLDAHIKHFSGKKIKQLDLAVILALRIGLYQLKFLTKIPARAAVNESVNLVYAARLRSAAGFVNAVLRKSEREKFNPLENIKNPLERLVIETSHPLWLLEKWQSEFGIEETEKLAKANNNVPVTAFRLTDFSDQSVLEELKKAGAVLTESKIVPNSWRIERANQKLRDLFAKGKIYLQDEASQLVANVCDVSAEESFLDVCAAPGSKTSLVASLRAQAQSSKFKVQSSLVAGDYSFARVKILRETIEKFAPEKVNLIRYNAEKKLPFAEKTFDCVLVDAPCSGTGTIRHNPEIRWHLQPEDFAILAEKQWRILSNAAELVKIGGRIIYSTCSLEREENDAVITKFLVKNIGFEQTTIDLPERFLTKENAARTFPHRDETDGFFVTVLRRKQ